MTNRRHAEHPITARAAVALTLLSSLMFGTSGTAQALGPHPSPIATSSVRLVVGSLLLIGMLPALGQSPRGVVRYLRNPLAWLAAAFVCTFQFGYFYSAQRAGVALGALITMGTIPLLTGMMGSVLGHRITLVWFVSTVVCASGLMLLGYQGVSGGDTLGIIAAVIAAVAGAGFTLTVKRMIDRGAQSDLAQAALFSIAGVAMMSTALLTQPMHWIRTPSGIALACWLGLITMAAPNYLWVRGLGALSPGVTATLLLGEPLLATVLGVVVLGERLTALGTLGLVLVFAGLVALSNSASTIKQVALHE